MSRDRYADRRRAALEAARTAGLVGLLATPGADLRYLSGYAAMPLERLTLLAVVAGREPFLLVPTLERPAAEAAEGVGGIELLDWRDGHDPYARVADLLERGTYAVTDQTWSAHLLGFEAAMPQVRFVASSRALPLLRAVKDDDELERLRGAGAAADAAFADVVRLPFAGRREAEIAQELDRLLRDHGHERVDFTIVGSGPNGASPHHDSGDRRIEAGDAVVMDFGGVRGGYFSDLTRTVFVGEPDEEHRRVYAIVHEAQEAAFAAVRPGAVAQDVDRAARSVIEAAGFGDRFVHRTGHGIGLEVHEPPYLVEGDETVLRPGMTFSDEPGIYLPGRFGVRIEDQVAVTVTGAERLNHATRDLVVVS